MDILKNASGAFIGLCGGLIVSGAVFAFIAVVGIVPRLAQKTGTQRYIKVYEEAIIVGGIFGCLAGIFDFNIPLGSAFGAFYGVCYGIFVGCVAICLAEVLNALPILTRRAKLQKGLGLFATMFALGKLTGSLLYFLVPGFFD